MVNPYKLERLRFEIASLSQTEDEAHKILQFLAETEWTPLLAKARLSEQAGQELNDENKQMWEILDKKNVRCSVCWQFFQYSHLAFPRLKKFGGWSIPKRDNKLCCPSCRETILNKYTRNCKFCNEQFIANNSQQSCRSCWWKDSKNLSRQVKRQLARVREKKQAATLTLSEWRSTVEHFEGKCAYCLNRPMEVLDHFVPITLGGGTTVGNCVPSCQCHLNKKRVLLLID
jgi:5-methylcytosine-specific restriction endonuclease McrA